MEGNGAQNSPNIPNNNLSTSGNINQQPVQIPPQMLEVWRRTQQGAPVIPYPVLTQALQLGPLQNDQYEALMQQTNALESYIPVIREHLRIRHLAYLGQSVLNILPVNIAHIVIGWRSSSKSEPTLPHQARRSMKYRRPRVRRRT